MLSVFATTLASLCFAKNRAKQCYRVQKETNVHTGQFGIVCSIWVFPKIKIISSATNGMFPHFGKYGQTLFHLEMF